MRTKGVDDKTYAILGNS